MAIGAILFARAAWLQLAEFDAAGLRRRGSGIWITIEGCSRIWLASEGDAIRRIASTDLAGGARFGRFDAMRPSTGG